jgi:hypothetical protein
MAISDQAAEASRSGGVLLPQDGVQVAGKFDTIIDIFRMLAKQPSRVGQGRMPTPAEERLLPNQQEYRARQEQQAPQMLSPEGLQRFEASGYNAQDAINPPPAAQALDVIDPVADTVQGARNNLIYTDPETMAVRPGASDKNAADQMDALGAVDATGPAQVGDFVRSGGDGLDFNFDRLQTGDDVKAMINQVSEIYADPIEAAKRGVITQKETLASAEQLLANELGFTRELLKRRRGETFNAEQATAARLLLVRSGERLTAMARAIRDGDQSPAALVAFRRQMSIHAGIQMQVKGMQTEIARALNAFNIPASARTPELQADIAIKMLNETGGSVEAVKLAKGLLKAQEKGGNAAVNKYAFGGWTSKANGVFGEVYVNGLLSWTYTHIKNALATPAFMAYQTVEEVIAGLYGGLERGVGRALGAGPQGFGRAGLGSTAEGVYAGQAAARLFGWSKALQDAWITAAETFRTELPADALSKIEGSQLRSIDAEALNMSGKAGQFVDTLGRAIRIPGRSLMAADDFWRVFAQRGELYAEAYHQGMMAKALGKTDQEALDNVAMSILDPRSYANRLDEAARYNSLTTDTGKLGEATALVQNFPVVGRMLLPFSKVPINSVLRVVERTMPTGLLKDPVARQKAMARVTLGYGAMYMFAEMAMNGRLTGAMPEDQMQRDMLPPGWRPYSLVFRGDNWPNDAQGDPLPIFDPRTGAPNGPLTYISYAGLEPVGAIIGISATVAERMRRSNDPEVSINYAATAIAAASDYFTDMPMIKVIGDIAKAMRDGDLSGIASGPLRGFMPYSAAIRAVERAIDPTIRRPSGQPEYYTIEDVEAGTDVPFNSEGKPRYELVGRVKGGIGASFSDAMDKWQSMLSDRTLFGGSDDATSAVQYDVFGEPREANTRFDVNPVLATYNMIIPFNVRHGEELNDLQYEQIRLKGPLRDTKRKEQGFAFSEAFRSEWTRVAKREIMTTNPTTGRAETFMGALGNLISSREYQSMNDQEQFNAIRDVEDRFYDQALQVVLSLPRYEDVQRAFSDYQDVQRKFKEEGRLRR